MLRDRNWVLHPQVGCSGYRIDIGVVDPRAPGRYLVGIECDGRSYHSGATARDRDRLRQHVLEGLGWRIYRIWSTDWWLNPEREIEKVVAQLQALLAEEAQGAEEAPSVSGDPAELHAPPETTGTSAQTPEHVAAEVPVGAVRSGAPSVYACAALPVGNPTMFYEPRSVGALVAQLRQVIEEEGPILEAVLFRRVARAWGLERTGSRIAERLRNMVPASCVKTNEEGATFYWPAGEDPETWRKFRVASQEESSRRNVAEVSLQEIGAVEMHVLDHGGGAPSSDIARSACRLLGMARTPADAEARVVQAMELLDQMQLITEVNGIVRSALISTSS
jgi:very-short-patch-repair endonuclease